MKNNIYKFWSLYLIAILVGFIIYSEVTISQFSVTHTNKLQGLLNNAVSELVLVNGDIYEENQQITIPAGVTLDVNGATIEPMSGLWRSSWDGNLHHEDFLIKLSDNSTIKNGTLNGLDKKGWGGITAYNVDNYTVTDMTIKSFRFTCMNTFNAQNVRISNNNFQESSIQPDNWESKYLYWNYLYNSEISYNNFSGVNGQRALAGGGMGVKFNGNVFYWENVEIHHNDFNLFPLHAWVNPASGQRGANYSLEINSNYNGTGLVFHHNTSNTGISFMRKNVTTDLNNDAYLYNNRFIMDKDATLCYEFENVHMTIENDYVTGARYVMGFFGKASAPNHTRDIIIRNCIFDTGANTPATIFTNGAITTGLVSIENSTIYCGDKALIQLFANTGSIGNTLQNYNLHKNLFINKTNTSILVSNAPKSGWNLSDNKFEGEWNTQEWSDNVSVTGAISGSGVKPFPFFASLHPGYGAAFEEGPIDPPSGNIFTDSFEQDFTEPPWRTYVGQNNPFRSTDYKLTGNYSAKFHIPIRTDYNNARSQAQFWGGDGVPIYAPNNSTFGYSFAIYIPADFKPDLWNEYYYQHKNASDPGHEGRDNNPPFGLGVHGTNYSTGSGLELYANIRTISKNPSTSLDLKTATFDNIATIKPGNWHYFIDNTHWDYSGSGYHKIYMAIGREPTESDLILDYEGGTGYNSQYSNSTYLNLYKWDWNNNERAQESKDAGITERLVYFEDFLIQDSKIKLEGGPIDPPEPEIGLDTLIITGKDLQVIYQ